METGVNWQERATHHDAACCRRAREDTHPDILYLPAGAWWMQGDPSQLGANLGPKESRERALFIIEGISCA